MGDQDTVDDMADDELLPITRMLGKLQGTVEYLQQSLRDSDDRLANRIESAMAAARTASAECASLDKYIREDIKDRLVDLERQALILRRIMVWLSGILAALVGWTIKGWLGL